MYDTKKIHLDKPAVMIELKWDKSAEGAIQQMKNKEYIDALKDYQEIYFWWVSITIKKTKNIAVLSKNGIFNTVIY